MRRDATMNIGQYVTPTIKILRRLGEGGMSTVWVAENLTLGTEVAVKVMSPGYAKDERMIERFRREACLAARIKSPHVTWVSDYGITGDGEPFIVMELLEGETMRKRMDRGPLPLADVAWLILQTAKGLAAAHRVGLAHRDIKPDNLFVIDNEGEAFMKVLDFGIVKDLAGGDFTTTGKILGTPLYMSPEQFDSKPVDQRTDLWSLGAVTFEALTGRPPFVGSTIPAIFGAIHNGEFEAPSVLRPELPKAVDTWMACAFARDIEQRFRSAMEMADALWRALGLVPIAAPPSARTGLSFARTVLDSTPPRLDWEEAESTRKWLNQQRPSKSERPLENIFGQESRFSVAENEECGLLSLSVRDTWPRAVAFDEAGEALFVTFASGEVLCLDLVSRLPRWWSRLDARPICPTVGAGWLVIGCKDGVIRTLDVSQGTTGSVLVWEKQAIQSLAMDPTTQTICACRGNGEMGLWSLPSGQRRPNVILPDDHVRSVAFDKTHGYWAGARGFAVHLWDQSFRTVQVLGGAQSSVRSIAFAPDGSYLAAGCGDGTILLWELEHFTLVRTFSGHTKRIGTLAVLPHQMGLVSTSSDRTLRVWNIETRRTEFVVDGRAGEVECVTSTNDGRMIATVSVDRQVRLYSWPIHRSLGKLPA